MEAGGGRRWRDREAAVGGLLLLLGVLVLAMAGGGRLIAVGLAAFLPCGGLSAAVSAPRGRTPRGAGRYTLAVLLILAGLVLLGRRLVGVVWQTSEDSRADPKRGGLR